VSRPIAALRWLRANHDWLLVLSCLPLFATNALFNLPLAAMGAIAAIRLARAPRAVLGDRQVRTLLAIFACLWLPTLAALPDAADPGRALRSALGYLRFALAGIYVVQTLQVPGRLERVAAGTFVIVTAWCLDAMVQFFAGRNLLGYPHEHLQLNGIFYPRYRLGLVSAVLLAGWIAGLRGVAQRRPWLALASVPVLAAIVLSGNRNAWMMTVLVLAGTGLWLHLCGQDPPWRRLAAIAAAVLAGLALVLALNAPLRERIALTAGLVVADQAEADRISGYRLSLWRTAWRVYTAHPINGVGPRGFRRVYAEYAPAGDFWLQQGRRGQTHPHQQLLEIAAETGTIGLAGYLGWWALLLGLARGARRTAGPGAGLWLLGIGVAAFPLNAHMAFYSSFWSALLWWLVPIGVAAAAPQNSQGASARRRCS